MSDAGEPVATGDMLRQAAALAVQDAVSNMRNVNIIANAALGVAQEMILNGADVEAANAAIAAAQAMVAAALQNFIAVGAAANTLIGNAGS
jgi:hypothetical protein